MLQGQVGVRGLRDRKLRTVGDQPGPTRSELRRGGVGELLGELLVRTERRPDRVGHRARGRSAAVRRHAVPEERVVPVLGGVVEQAAVDLGPRDDLLEALAGVVGALDGSIQLAHVTGVVLAVVVLEGLRAHVGLQRLGVEGEGGSSNAIRGSFRFIVWDTSHPRPRSAQLRLWSGTGVVGLLGHDPDHRGRRGRWLGRLRPGRGRGRLRRAARSCAGCVWWSSRS